jgi:hypothetical protein
MRDIIDVRAGNGSMQPRLPLISVKRSVRDLRPIKNEVDPH